MDLADKYNAVVIEHKKFIGGRYSVLSEGSMFPAALMGLNLKEFNNLKKLIKDKNFISSLIHNVASIYTLNLKKINNSIIFNYDSSLSDLGYWYQQLVAESLGKEGKGINPFISSGKWNKYQLNISVPSTYQESSDWTLSIDGANYSYDKTEENSSDPNSAC